MNITTYPKTLIPYSYGSWPVFGSEWQNISRISQDNYMLTAGFVDNYGKSVIYLSGSCIKTESECMGILEKHIPALQRFTMQFNK